MIGVSYGKQRNKYEAYIHINNKKVNLGRYKIKEEAIIARLEAEVKYYGYNAPQKNLFDEYKIIPNNTKLIQEVS